jgi:uncharacterized protein (DUF1015 family)
LAEVRPFRGLRYNREIVRDLGQVICPPYDVISPEQQNILYHRSPYNIVRLEHGQALHGDDAENNRHTRAAAVFTEWRDKGVLRLDTMPSIYVHDHFFGENGELKRRGFVARVRLEPPEKRTVLPHENTVSGIKSDRLMLLRACRTNISPIFVLYHDQSGRIADILEQATKAKPIADCTVPEGEGHRLWAITDTVSIEGISRVLYGQTLYIADGHHRYETSMAYQQEMLSKAASYTGQEGFNFIMMTLVSFDDPGLIIYPIHRMVHGLTPAAIRRLEKAFEDVFDVQYVTLDVASDSARLLGETKGLFVVVGLVEGKAGICRIRADLNVDRMMPAERSSTYRRLAVSLLHHLVLDRLPEYSEGQASITYTHDEVEACKAVREGVCQVAVLLPPTSPSTIKEIADSGDRMPGKSTFFYPKLPTGLVLNYLETSP